MCFKNLVISADTEAKNPVTLDMFLKLVLVISAVTKVKKYCYTW